MITTESLDLKDEEKERNSKPIELETEEVRLFGELNT